MNPHSKSSKSTPYYKTVESALAYLSFQTTAASCWLGDAIRLGTLDKTFKVCQTLKVLARNLTMADVFGLQLNAKLVSLSACNTGGGKRQRGEGVMGLTRAFMYAGTPAIAVTYWSVESYSAKTLSVGFFQQFKEIPKPAMALRAIKLRMLRGDEGQKYKRPYYWAPFVVYGDAQ